MHRYKHILIAADLISSDDDPISERAEEIAAASGAVISLVHVIEPFYHYISPYVMEKTMQWQEQTVASCSEKLAILGQKLGVPEKRQFTVVGVTNQAILSVAKEIEADLIMVGSHGRHGLGLLFFGSTAKDIMAEASCDVLAVNIGERKSELEPVSNLAFSSE